MKICVAQTKAFPGDVKSNIENHQKLIKQAILQSADLMIFPELSLTGYEPTLAKELSTYIHDPRLSEFQKLSDTHQITLGVGMPIKSSSGTLIGMILYQPGRPQRAYYKQHLHEDEIPYFIAGKEEVILGFGEHAVAPAICYEALLPEHSEIAANNGATIYIASVAKSSAGVGRATRHFQDTALKYSMTILMANGVGVCDNFVAAGKSSVWNSDGKQLAQMNENGEGLLFFDTETQKTHIEMIENSASGQN